MDKKYLNLRPLEWISLIFSVLIILGVVRLFAAPDDKKSLADSENRIFAEQIGLFGQSTCNIAHLPVRGIITTYAGDPLLGELGLLPQTSSWSLVRKIDQAENDPEIKAIILEIDSLGGLPYASEEVLQALDRTTKPVIALVRGFATSGAYYLAIGADYLIAGNNSEVGSIGVMASYIDETEKLEQEGLEYIRLVSGEYKDIGSPYVELNQNGRNYLEGQIDTLYELFVNQVAQRRELEVESVKKLADGRTFFGQEAFQNGLIDEVGGINESLNWLTENIETKPILCTNYGIDFWSLAE